MRMALKPLLICLALLAIGLSFPAAQAKVQGIQRSSGNIKRIPSPPASVELGDLESDRAILVFVEPQGKVRQRTIRVDISRPGDDRNQRQPRAKIDWDSLSPAVIPARTRVDPHSFHVDSATYRETLSVRGSFRCENQIDTWGEVTFARPAIGIAMRAYRGSEDHLGITNRELGLPGAPYEQHNFRHFPRVNIADGCGTDNVIQSDDRRTLWGRNFTDVHHDTYRVIVQTAD